MEAAMTVIKMSEEEWATQYRPEVDEDGAVYVQRCWTDEGDMALIEEACEDNRLWTMCEGDGGNMCIVQGYRRVNRMFYIITEEACDPDTEVIVESEIVYCIDCGNIFRDLSDDGDAVMRSEDGMTCTSCASDEHENLCEQGIHSWIHEAGVLPPDAKCADCGEEYGEVVEARLFEEAHARFVVIGSHGHIDCDPKTGEVLEFHDQWEGYSSRGIVRFDLEDYRAFWEDDTDEADYVEMGFWDADGRYEEPEWDFRVHALVEGPEQWLEHFGERYDAKLEQARREAARQHAEWASRVNHTAREA
jgi:hypothetical protein